MRTAVIGAGPSGFYAAEALLKQKDVPVEVDVFDRLPTPYGLVRGGVAPDHQKIKQVCAVYEKTAQLPGFRFLGNVKLGRDLSADELRGLYDMVVYAVGNEGDRKLGIPGEDLRGGYSATEFVYWYNGHPDYRHLEFDLSAERAAIFGIGNVAVDVTRILGRDPEELKGTDIADYALAALRKSRIREVYMIGRRGPAQAAYSPAEVRELGGLPNTDLVVDPKEAALDEHSKTAYDGDPEVRKNVDYVQEIAKRGEGKRSRKIRLRFLTSPAEFIGANGRVSKMRLERNALVKNEKGALSAKGTGQFETLDVGPVFRSVGYRGIPIPGVSFDDKAGKIPNADGRVLDAATKAARTGEYVVGWAKRGPSGLIGTNRADSVATVQLMLSDAKAGKVLPGGPKSAQAVTAALDKKGARYVTFQDWKRLDAIELARGKQAGKVREKFSDLGAMLDALKRDSRSLTVLLGTLLFCVAAARALPSAPRLVVVVSVDQMRADYLERFAPDYKGGLALLGKEGAVFPLARYSHVPTETAPGHAAILTGRLPAEHGIIGNDWWDRAAGKAVYALEDPLFGRSPANLLAYTVGDALKAKDPSCKVAAFSGKDRGAILLGGKRADAVLWYDRKTGDFTTSGYYGPLPPWATAYNIETHSRPPLAGATTTYYKDLLADPLLDRLTEGLAERGLAELALGRDEHPDILAVSLSANDYIGHKNGGPDNPRLREVLLAVDETLGRLFEALDRKVGMGNYAVVLTGDHGIAHDPESPEGKARGLRRLLHDDFIRQAEAALIGRWGASPRGKWLLGSFPPNLYLDREAVAKSRLDWALFLRESAGLLRGLPDIAEVFTPADMEGWTVSSSTYAAVFRNSYNLARSGDLLVRFDEGVMYAWERETAHGSPYDDDSMVPLILWGPGVRRGRYDTPVRVTDLAPTLGRWLDVDFPPAPGSRVLEEAF